MDRASDQQKKRVAGTSKKRISMIRTCLLLLASCTILSYIYVLRHALSTRQRETTIISASALRIDARTSIRRRTPTVPRYSRTLVGILVDFSKHGKRYRKRFRSLFALHPNVCSIGDLKDESIDTSECELVYTFVVGAGPEESGGMRLQTPFLVPSVQQTCDKVVDQTDCSMSDITLLNIKENMNWGKSPTWFAYGASIAQQFDISYVAKLDTDTIIYLDKFFEFARTNLPPAPFATDIFAGWFADKLVWPHNRGKNTVDVRKFTHKSNLTLFAQGQFYLLSCDLAMKMAKAIMEHPQFSSQGYIEEHEDRDVASAVLLGSGKQLHYIFISKEDLFWQHRVKIWLGKKFHQEWDKELMRLKSHIKDSFGNDMLSKLEAKASLLSSA